MLIFDYDGVLLNSLDDVVLTSWNAVKGTTESSLSQLPEDYVALMRLNRFHCQPAGDFLVLAQAIVEGKRPAESDCFTTDEYQSFLNNDELNPLVERTKLFFNARKRLVEKNEQAWLNLNTCLLYTSPSPRDATLSRMPSSA